MDVNGKVTLITGASAGIGLATTRLFAQHGAKLGLAARSTAKLEKLAQELPDAIAVPTDMCDQAAVRAMVEKVYEHYGRIDVLINNAGQAIYAPIEHIDLEQYQNIITLNVIGPLCAMQAVIPRMREHGGGVIVNISSAVSKMHIPNLGGYASTKYALNSLTLTARAELEKDNIRVGVVFPRMTATDFGRNAFRDDAHLPSSGGPRSNPNIPVDTPEMVAERILDAVINERAEQTMEAAQQQIVAR